MLNKSIVARLVARSGKEEEVAAFLTSALPLANEEHFMPVWFALRAGATADRDEALAVQSGEVYDRYMKYLTGCAEMFRRRQVDINQFTLEK